MHAVTNVILHKISLQRVFSKFALPTHAIPKFPQTTISTFNQFIHNNGVCSELVEHYPNNHIAQRLSLQFRPHYLPLRTSKNMFADLDLWNARRPNVLGSRWKQ
jgi:hypothetical protein